MKHQYFGDISDYRKYNILRTLVNKGNLKPLVCWLLTTDDTKSDGNNNIYLKDPVTWRKYDPAVFDFIHNRVIVQNVKNLAEVENSGLLTNVGFFSKVLEDTLSSRTDYFRTLYSVLDGFDLIFLDPDNGIETKTVTKGRKNSSKYIFFDEIRGLWLLGKSLLIYQHFPRVDRIDYMTKQLEQLDTVANPPYLFALKTSYMAYFALASEKTMQSIKYSFLEIQRNWAPYIEAYSYDKDLRSLRSF